MSIYTSLHCDAIGILEQGQFFANRLKEYSSIVSNLAELSKLDYLIN